MCALSVPGACVSPQKLKKCIDKCTSQFPYNKQCDAHELLIFLIDRLHDEAIRRGVEEINKLFYGAFTSRIQCMNCHSVSITNEPFMCISLPIDGNTEELPLILQTEANQLYYFLVKFGEETTVKEIKGEAKRSLAVEDVDMYLLVDGKELEEVFDSLLMSQAMSSGKSWRLYAIEKSKNETNQTLIRLDIGKPNSPLFLKYPKELIEKEDEFREALTTLIANSQVSKKDKSIQHSFSLTKGIVHITQKGLSYLHVELKPLSRNSHFSNILKRIPCKPIRLLHRAEDYESLEECLKGFTTAERLKGGDQTRCERCCREVEASKKVDYLQLPQVLVIHLKRFKVRCNKVRIKISRFISFPMNLKLEKADGGVERYGLYGVINHMGGIERGHYTAFCKSAAWTQFNDSKVSPLDEDRVVTDNAYILFYEKINS
eukprot:TRINITY_DN2291_c0_g5_i1.p1 TRINITY_DN2291_c0_g5~~TRINITY_DN2291_c0_g5_i1.p1  ORF type:complete len:431 (-),score=108.47 TRINITY_DN2291_c0_g5_i1:63-1355(-)